MKKLNQKIRYLRTTDGVQLAWAEAGTGPVMIKAANWLTHLDYEWESPVWRHWIRFFSDNFRYIRYDERGCGMSERDVAELSVDRAVEDLEAVTAAARPQEPFVLVGVSQGGAAAIRYAVANPSKVSHLVLYGAYAQGRAMQHDRGAEEAQRARIALTRTGWGQNNPVYRQLFTSRFIPGATDEQIRWFNDLCKITASAEMAARIMAKKAAASDPGPILELRGPSSIRVSNAPLAPLFTSWLSTRLGLRIINRTGLLGPYTFDLEWQDEPTGRSHAARRQARARTERHRRRAAPARRTGARSRP